MPFSHTPALPTGLVQDARPDCSKRVRLDGFDMALIDADKENLIAYYERCFRPIRSSGLLLIDNTLWNGEVADHLKRDATGDTDEHVNPVPNAASEVLCCRRTRAGADVLDAALLASPIDAAAADPEPPLISVGLIPAASIASTSPALAIAVLARPLYFPAALALAMPSRWRSSIIERSHSATLPSDLSGDTSCEPIHTRSADPECLGHFGGSDTFVEQTPDLGHVDALRPTLIDPSGLCRADPFELTFTPKIKSRTRQRRLNISRKALPAAVEVSTGCSVAFRCAPFARSSWTMF